MTKVPTYVRVHSIFPSLKETSRKKKEKNTQFCAIEQGRRRVNVASVCMYVRTVQCGMLYGRTNLGEKNREFSVFFLLYRFLFLLGGEDGWDGGGKRVKRARAHDLCSR